MTKTPSKNEGCGCGRPPIERAVRPDADVERAIEALRGHERRVLEGLAKPGMEERFLRSPKEVLESLGIPVPSELAHHLARVGRRALDAVAPPASIVLPNGQRLRPRVKVRIAAPTGGE